MGSSQSSRGYKSANGRKKRIHNHFYYYNNLTTTATTAATAYETRAANVNGRATNVVTAVDHRSNSGVLRAGGRVDHEDDGDECIDLKATEYIERVREKLRLQNEFDDGLENAVRSSEGSAAGSGGDGDYLVSPPSIDAQAEAYISSVRDKLLLEK